MKRSFLENRRVAWIALAVCAVLSVAGLGGMKMARERGAVENVFYSGTDTSLSVRHSMDAYLDRAADAAEALAGEGAALLGETNADAASAAGLAKQVRDEQDLSARYGLYTQLSDAVETLYNALLAKKLPEDSMVNAQLAYADFGSAGNLIKNDQYRDMARQYNDRTDGFPANLLGGLYGLHEMDTYGG